MIIEYTRVKIARIDGDVEARIISSSYDPPNPPTVGEEGIVVHELEGGDYVVEKVEPNGYSTWIAWFRESELTPLD